MLSTLRDKRNERGWPYRSRILRYKTYPDEISRQQDRVGLRAMYLELI